MKNEMSIELTVLERNARTILSSIKIENEADKAVVAAFRAMYAAPITFDTICDLGRVITGYSLYTSDYYDTLLKFEKAGYVCYSEHNGEGFWGINYAA